MMASGRKSDVTQKYGNGDQKETLVVNVVGMDSSWSGGAASPTGAVTSDKAGSYLSDSCSAPSSEPVQTSGRVGRSTFINTVLTLDSPQSVSSHSEINGDLSSNSSSTADQRRLTEFVANGHSYMYHGCTERPVIIKPSKSSPRKAKSPVRRFVKLHIIEQTTTREHPAKSASVLTGRAAAGQAKEGQTQRSPKACTNEVVGQPQPGAKPKPMKKPKPVGFTGCRTLENQPTSISPVALNQRTLPNETCQTPLLSERAAPETVVEMLKNGTASVGAQIIVLNATHDNASFRRQEEFVLQLMQDVAWHRDTPTILVSTKNDLLGDENTAWQREEWVKQFAEKASVEHYFHTSCEPYPVNICYAIDSLLAIAMGGEKPAGESSFISLKSKHADFISTATDLASLFAASMPESFLSWKAWKELGGKDDALYRQLLILDEYLGETLAKCLHRHRILHTVLQEHADCCFASDKSKVSMMALSLSVGKTTLADVESDDEIARGNSHNIWKKLRLLPVLMKPVSPASVCLYPVVASVTRNCAPAKAMYSTSSSALTPGSHTRYIHVVERANRQSMLDLCDATSPEADDGMQDEECYEVMQPFHLDEPQGPAEQPVSPPYRCVQKPKAGQNGIAAPMLSSRDHSEDGVTDGLLLRKPRAASAPMVVNAPVANRQRTFRTVPIDENSGSNSSNDSAAIARRNLDSQLDDEGYMEIPPQDKSPKKLKVQSRGSLPAMLPVSPRREKFRKHVAMRKASTAPSHTSMLPVPPMASQHRPQSKFDTNVPTGSDRVPTVVGMEKSQETNTVFTFDRQISRSMEDLRTLYEEIPHAKVQEWCTREPQVAVRSHYQLPTSSNPASPNLHKMSPSQQANPLKHDSKVKFSRRSKLLFRDTEIVDHSSSMLRINARHPAITTACFDVYIAADTRSLGWQQAMLHLKSMDKMSFKVKQTANTIIS
ncbi:uncharacterized protein LOC135821579 [Sycon ciliatum]|uniref:uncharacterized protein LOC135821579 n=1 Tax=Sycon ciliatum TaxID=27933 RepID=UPI0031F68460